MGTPYDGDGSAWENVKALASNFHAVSPYLNVTNYTDFLLVVLAGSAELEARTVGPVAPGSGFKFQMNDADGYLRGASDRTDKVLVGVDNTYGLLREEEHPNFKMLIADRIHKHFFNGGVFTPARNIDRLNAWGDILEKTMIAEVARWKHMKIKEVPDQYGFSTPDEWKTKKDAYIASKAPGLTSKVVDRFKRDGLYPLLDAPRFNQHGGTIPESFQLEITAPTTIYYTLDGSDPRLPGGGISPVALDYISSSSTETLIALGSDWKYLDNGSDQGTVWTDPDFNDGGWNAGPAELGYGDGGAEATVVSYGPDSQNKYITTYFRHSILDVEDANLINQLTLNLRRDDGAVVYINGVEVLRDGFAAGTVNYDTPSTNVVSGSGESTYYSFSLFPSTLVDGENVIAVEIHQRSGTSSDISFDFELIAHRSSGTSSTGALLLDQDVVIKARTWDGSVWSALNEATFIIEGNAPAAVDNLVISEINYNPDGADDYEFIEFYNPSTNRIDLSGVTVSTGIHFIFPDGSFIAPSGYAVIARNADLFEARYQEIISPWYYADINVMGQWIPSESLDNGGESITVLAADGSSIMSFSYSDGGGWPSRADGDGSSLQLIAADEVPTTLAEKNNYLANAFYWQPSSEYHGSPGRAGTYSNVVINEILSHSDIGEDWIELYNLGASTVNVGGWNLSDSFTDLTKYTIPGGTQIYGKNYLTFTESQLGFAFSELGEEAALTVFSGSDLLYFIDLVDFGAGDREVSFGRHLRVDGSADFTALSALPQAEKTRLRW
jgi:hypothetical protein